MTECTWFNGLQVEDVILTSIVVTLNQQTYFKQVGLQLIFTKVIHHRIFKFSNTTWNRRKFNDWFLLWVKFKHVWCMSAVLGPVVFPSTTSIGFFWINSLACIKQINHWRGLLRWSSMFRITPLFQPVFTAVPSQTGARNVGSDLLSLITDKISLEISAGFPDAATRCST